MQLFQHTQMTAFTIPGMGQLQPTRMQQGSMTAGFTMSELMCRALGPIPESGVFEKNSEPSLLQGSNLDTPAPLTFYQDDILGGQPDYYESFAFLQDHLFPQIEWALLRLSFKRLFLFQESINALGVKHTVGGRLQVVPTKLEKIMRFPIPQNPKGVRAFLGTTGITRRWDTKFL